MKFETPVTAVLFDFDGTISTLRDGWEEVMETYMLECLGEGYLEKIKNYIDESTGIQTISQMKWLCEKTKGSDPWEYKAEYNRRLMEKVNLRRNSLNEKTRKNYLIPGSEELLKALSGKGIDLYVASGTDGPDVKAEAEALGLAKYFKKIAGSPIRAENCSKEMVIRDLLNSGIDSDNLAVVGDGKVEITIGRECNARTLGIARNEKQKQKLIKAGADLIVEDFSGLDILLKFFL